MNNEALKNFIKSIRRFQKNFKWSLGGVLVIVLMIAGGVLYARHQMATPSLPTPNHDMQLPAGPSPTPEIAPTPATQQMKNAKTAWRKTNRSGFRTTAKNKGKGRVTPSQSRVVTRTASRISPRTTLYRVQKGDSLWKISSKEYHTGKLWPRIYTANQKVIGANSNRIYPGTRLAIPVVRGR